MPEKARHHHEQWQRTEAEKKEGCQVGLENMDLQ